MQRPKQQALAFLLGALLVGGVVGFSADRALRPEESSRAAKRLAMYDDLALTPSQRAAMDSLLDARNCQFDSVFKTIQPALDSVTSVSRAQIGGLLTPEQRERFDARRKERDARDAVRKRTKSSCLK